MHKCQEKSGGFDDMQTERNRIGSGRWDAEEFITFAKRI